LRRFAKAPDWATTLRADVVNDVAGRPHIVEVNSENVAGFENLLLYLHFYEQMAPAGSTAHALVRRNIGRLEGAYRWWLDEHYAAFRQSASDQHPLEVDGCSIVVCYEDRDHCIFIGRALAEQLRRMGLDAMPCRPEHLVKDHDGLFVREPMSGRTKRVDVVLRHWLAFEMYDATDRVLGERFKPLLEAVAEGLVLFLNPISERLLFSKALLAELHREHGGIFQLDDAQRAFVHKYIVPTSLPHASSEIMTKVYKPYSEYGGKGVTICEDSRGLLLQDRVQGRRVPSRYLEGPAFKPAVHDLHVVHGLLVYGAQGESRLGGVMSRMGPNPVVNFAPGAQVVASLLE